LKSPGDNQALSELGGASLRACATLIARKTWPINDTGTGNGRQLDFVCFILTSHRSRMGQFIQSPTHSTTSNVLRPSHTIKMTRDSMAGLILTSSLAYIELKQANNKSARD